MQGMRQCVFSGVRERKRKSLSFQSNAVCHLKKIGKKLAVRKHIKNANTQIQVTLTSNGELTTEKHFNDIA